MGTAVMRIADAQLIPYDYVGLAETVQRYVGQLDSLAKKEADSIAEVNREVRDSVFAMTNDPRRPTVTPDTIGVPVHLDFAPLQNGADALTRAAAGYAQAAAAAQAGDGAALTRPEVAAVNVKIMQSERTLTSADGLPGRPWYRHLLYAPGLYTGYGVKTVPAVREAIEQHQPAVADSEIVRVGAVLQAEAVLVTDAARQLVAIGH